MFINFVFISKYLPSSKGRTQLKISWIFYKYSKIPFKKDKKFDSTNDRSYPKYFISRLDCLCFILTKALFVIFIDVFFRSKGAKKTYSDYR